MIPFLLTRSISGAAVKVCCRSGAFLLKIDFKGLEQLGEFGADEDGDCIVSG